MSRLPPFAGLLLPALALASPWLPGCRGEPAKGSPRGAETALAPLRVPLGAGDAAPDVSALSHTGYTVRLADFCDRPVVIYFCPSGLDADCTALARALRDRWLTLNQRLSMVLLASPSGYAESRAFATLEELPFLILADAERAVAASFGVPVPSPGAPAPALGFLIGTDRRISKVFERPAGEGHVAELSQALPAAAAQD